MSSTLYVYGDSYSFDGKSPFTNGPLWSTLVADQWGLTLLNMAEPGATFCKNKGTKSWLGQQIKKKKEIESGSVHMIFLGMADVMSLTGKMNVKQWIECVHQEVSFLHSKEARIIIMGVPALEFSPYAINHELTDLKENIMNLNVELEESVSEWKETIPVEFFDTYLVFSDILGDPAPIQNVEDAYWDTCTGRCSDSIDSYLWYDSVHVTGAGHRAIASAIESKEYFDLKAPEQLIPVTEIPSMAILTWFIVAVLIALGLYMVRHHPLVLKVKKRFGWRQKPHSHVEYAPV
ncbi:hypothetical protein BDB01DRAFT_838865 [Pilobolus umbonatus]|nr:hypothetical protein BDB01DRAFT_838865 [Pilobolus umbonatus]